MRKLLSIILVIVLVLGSFTSVMAAPKKSLKDNEMPYPKTTVRKLEVDPRAKGLKDEDSVRIIVELVDRPIIEHAYEEGVRFKSFSKDTVNALKESIVSAQESVKSDIETREIDIKYHESFMTVVNGFSGTTTFEEAKKIESIPNVKRVVLVNEYSRPEPQMVNSKDLVNAALTWGELGYDGEGMVVAVLDTGIDPDHKDMILTNPGKAKYSELGMSGLIDTKNLPGTYRTSKVPYGYNYMDNNQEILDLGPDASRHGMHVAGTVGANGDEENDGIKGVAPEAQLLAMKVFGNDPSMPSTFGDIIIRAIEDSVALGADVINMSLGSTSSFVVEDDPEQQAVAKAVRDGVFMSISAGNADKFGSPYEPYASNPDVGVVGSPGLTAESMQVASSNNKLFLHKHKVEADGLEMEVIGYGKDDWRSLSSELELVAIGGNKLGTPDNYDGIDIKGKVALVSRGAHAFKDKTKWASEAGAIAILVYNNDPTRIFYVNQGGWEIPFMKVQVAEGAALEALVGENGGSMTIEVSHNEKYIDPATGSMSDFTSWGTTPNLDFKPDITAPGGNIYSTDQNNGYQYMSGTSMAAPHVAGGAALVLERVNEEFPQLEGQEKIEMAKNLMMSTAKPVSAVGTYNDHYGFEHYVSPRRQGAGAMDLYAASVTPAIVTDKSTGLSKVSLKEIDEESTFTVTVTNFSDETVSYAVYGTVTTDLVIDGINKREVQGVYIDGTRSDNAPYTGDFPIFFAEDDMTVAETVYGAVYNTVVVPAGDSVDIDVTVDLEGAVDWFYDDSLLDVFENGTFVEGFVELVNIDDKSPDLSIPYTGFYGDWDEAPIIDKGVYDMEDSFYGHTGMLDENQVYLGVNADGDFDASKIAISPNNDGVKDITLPVLSFLRNAKELDINILDANGNKVRDLVTEYNIRKDYYDSGVGSQYKIHDIWTWDAMINNKLAEDGQYFYQINTKIDYKGASWQTDKFPVYVDTSAPEMIGYTYDSDSKELTINATDDGIGISKYVLSQGEEMIAENATGEFDLSVVEEGPQTFEVIVVDYAGNKNNKKIAIEDNTIPYVIIDTPEYLGIYNTSEVEVKGSIADATGLKYLQINDEDVDFALNDETGNYEFTNVLTLEDGIRVFDVTAEDIAGNLINFEHKIFVDTVNPTIEMIEEPTAEVVEHTVESLTVAANISDNFGELRIKVNGNEVYYVADDWEYMKEAEPVNYALESYEVALEDGDNIITVEAYDAAGNETIKEYHVYRLAEGEELGDLAIESVNIENTEYVSSERPVTIKAVANQEVNWEVKVINPDEDVEATFTQTGERFESTWSPDEAKKLNGEFKIEIKATMNGETVMEEAVFNVYNYPVKVKDIEVIKKDGYVAIEASMENLGPNQESPMLLIQVTDENHRIINISTAKMEGLLAGQTVNLSSGFRVDATGSYDVDVYVWTGWNNTKSLSIPHTVTFEVE